MVDPTEDPEVLELYADFERCGLLPLWTQLAGLMPSQPRPATQAHVWRWREVAPLAARAGRLVPVGRGGERRAIALANPGLDGRPFATATLWAAVQQLGPGEHAPAHRHSQSAFRFVLEGEGVWTLVDGDPVSMHRGDLLLTPAWAWHEHQNAGDGPMLWLDGLDIPLVGQLDASFFELGPDALTDRSTPATCRSERLWAHPGLLPLTGSQASNSPLAVYRWEHSDAALDAQLELAAEGHIELLQPGHAAIRFVDPRSGRDALRTIRLELHRLAPRAQTGRHQEVGSSVLLVFSGSGTVDVGDERLDLGPGDLVAVPSWCPLELATTEGMDVFRFGDAPVHEALGTARP